VLDASGELVHREGATPAPGLFALGLRFQRTRKSHFLGGVGEDAAWIAEVIVAGPSAARMRSAA
jgi:putative flavoprotein involved in K+ transport